MQKDDMDIANILAGQGSLVRELVHDEVEHGVLIPLKTTLELRDDHITGRVLITRTPVKCVNNATRYCATSPLGYPWPYSEAPY
jgi:tRNA-specific adenosine deaminase 3